MHKYDPFKWPAWWYSGVHRPSGCSFPTTCDILRFLGWTNQTTYAWQSWWGEIPGSDPFLNIDLQWFIYPNKERERGRRIWKYHFTITSHMWKISLMLKFGMWNIRRVGWNESSSFRHPSHAHVKIGHGKVKVRGAEDHHAAVLPRLPRAWSNENS